MDIDYRAEKPLGYQQIVLAGSTALTVPVGTAFANVTPEAGDVRWRDDGTAPTASVGYPLAAGAELQYTGTPAALAALRFIGQTAGAVLNVCYYGYN